MAEPAAELSETDLALIDSLTLIFDLVIGGSDVRAQQLAALIDRRILHWAQKEKPRTAAILSLVKREATDPAVRQIRLERLGLKETKGTA